MVQFDNIYVLFNEAIKSYDQSVSCVYAKRNENKKTNRGEEEEEKKITEIGFFVERHVDNLVLHYDPFTYRFIKYETFSKFFQCKCTFFNFFFLNFIFAAFT